MSTPSERFLTYYETCFALKKLKLSEFLNEEFNFKSSVKYQVKFSSTAFNFTLIFACLSFYWRVEH